jgi:GNAT superfamily N-acetyltransferase
MTQAVIRRADVGDVSAVRELMGELGYYVELGRLEPTLRALVASQESVVFVHESDGRVDALIALSFRAQLHRGSLTATIDELVTRSEHRGRGIGRRLVRASVDEARRRGAFHIELSTQRNRASYERGFYDSCGFVESPSALFRMVLS